MMFPPDMPLKKELDSVFTSNFIALRQETRHANFGATDNDPWNIFIAAKSNL